MLSAYPVAAFTAVTAAAVNTAALGPSLGRQSEAGAIRTTWPPSASRRPA